MLDDGACLDTDRLVVAVGARPNPAGSDSSISVSTQTHHCRSTAPSRVAAEGSLWAIGDVAGWGAYTHLANHQARVVADALAGGGGRRFDDVVVPACVFTDPPVITVGPTPAELGDTVLWESASLSEVPRATTDELGDGYLAIGVDTVPRAGWSLHMASALTSMCSQPRLVTAIDAQVPVEQLARSMWPFPTVGELLGVIYSRASASLGAD